MKIYEVEGEKDIVIVIPTANHDGEYARNCANEIFKGQQIIFVESSGPFFNYARSCNFGLKYALKYKPKWVVLSNDDEYKIDDISILKNDLSELDNTAIDNVFVKETKYHSHPISIYKQRLLLLYRNFNRYNKTRLELFKKYNIKFLVRQINFYRKFFMKTVYTFELTGSFAIFSSNFLSSGNFLNEAYINSMEDVDLSLRISKGGFKTKYVDFKIGDYIAKSLGWSVSRTLRNVANLTYINKKFNF
jgi:GT2 family glycosyltransferase